MGSHCIYSELSVLRPSSAVMRCKGSSFASVTQHGLPAFVCVFFCGWIWVNVSKWGPGVLGGCVPCQASP